MITGSGATAGPPSPTLDETATSDRGGWDPSVPRVGGPSNSAPPWHPPHRCQVKKGIHSSSREFARGARGHGRTRHGVVASMAAGWRSSSQRRSEGSSGRQARARAGWEDSRSCKRVEEAACEKRTERGGSTRRRPRLSPRRRWARGSVGPPKERFPPTARAQPGDRPASPPPAPDDE